MEICLNGSYKDKTVVLKLSIYDEMNCISMFISEPGGEESEVIAVLYITEDEWIGLRSVTNHLFDKVKQTEALST